MPAPDARQDCGSVSRAFFGFDDLDFVSVDVGLNLPPAAANAPRRHRAECG